jgi:tetratricopeptide (TPR) repeat protein
VGKTQVAVEYAYRHREEYSAILWASAATQESLQGDFVKIAHLLNLPEKNAQEQAVTIEAVRRWLARERDWLLILDNADELPQIRAFLPDTRNTNGHILITTRDPAAGNLAEPLEVTQMERAEGTQLLLRRARKLAQATDEDRAQAAAIVDLLGALPLALDQAGAYIEENRCSLADYQALYRQRRKELLGWLGRFPPDYPRVVATTWDLSFRQVEQASPAADLLRLCAFLDPDSIPEELLSKGASELGPVLASVAADPFALNQTINHLLRYSLLRRDPTAKTLTIHRLVQAVLLDRMDKKTRRRWAERTVRAINRAFPYEANDYRNWPLCQRLLPHVQSCAALVDQYALSFREAADLFHRTGMYLRARALYEQAEVFFKRVLLIDEKVDGPEHPSTVMTLGELSSLYLDWRRYEQAEPLLQRARSIFEKSLGSEHPHVATSLHELARLSQARGHYEQAEELYQHALSIFEKSLGLEHPDTATTLHELARLYQNWGRYEQAEELYQRALGIKEKSLGSEHPNTALTMHELARLYQALGQYEQAEELYQSALTIFEKNLGSEHPNTAITLGALGALYEGRGEYERAEDYYRRALAVLERVLGDEHPNTIVNLRNYASFLREVGRDV